MDFPCSKCQAAECNNFARWGWSVCASIFCWKKYLSGFGFALWVSGHYVFWQCQSSLDFDAKEHWRSMIPNDPMIQHGGKTGWSFFQAKCVQSFADPVQWLPKYDPVQSPCGPFADLERYFESLEKTSNGRYSFFFGQDTQYIQYIYNYSIFLGAVSRDVIEVISS